ncbi:hypothetical protein [Actinoplanes regularis]|uniref:hypothetical protein n=1 Tax=Actinoplanes regularis TaxID=52697 RepID=UPI000B77910C|nr:hypothetical protein [Actinoplanes regularis]GIE86990.1 hypothetical protein Are01nite_34700 [Actinoplanes regularis]
MATSAPGPSASGARRHLIALPRGRPVRRHHLIAIPRTRPALGEPEVEEGPAPRFSRSVLAVLASVVLLALLCCEAAVLLLRLVDGQT